jgi:tetratricopeptide (TPR) repeat protein
MFLNWFDTREATATGAALADDFLQQNELEPKGAGRKGAGGRAGDAGLQRLLEKFLRRVDSDTRTLKLNLLKRARLANSFKWRLLEQGMDQQIVEELTRELVLRISANQGSPAPQTESSQGGMRRIQALHDEANGLLAKGALSEALQAYQRLVSLDSRDATARNGLGAAFAHLGQYPEAEAEFRQAIAIRPSFPEAYFNLAGVHEATGRYYEAEMPLRRALKLKPSYADARARLGANFLLVGRLEEARDCCEKVLRISPRHVQALVGLGQTEALMGHFAEAEALYKRALEVDQSHASAWAALASLRKMTPADGAWIKRAEELAAGGVAAKDEAALRFAIGKYYDDVQDFPRAFRSFQQANKLHKRRARPYDRRGHSAFIDDLMRVYTRDTLSAARAGTSDNERPVFVVGMPRSGTSLIEQIIASHPSAAGAGELNYWTIVVRKHEAAIRQQLLDATLRKKLAADYQRELTAHSSQALRVVDKAPINADYLGLIHSVFPKARIIYAQRDPIDTCMSCYFQQLQPSLNFTMDLGDLAHYYRQHRRLMDHWHSVLPETALLEVPYAELVADQEKWTRRIIEFIGLPWDPQTLEFHQNKRAVTTASAWQVRQKIYKTSVERWRNYKKFIGPLLELGDSTT